MVGGQPCSKQAAARGCGHDVGSPKWCCSLVWAATVCELPRLRSASPLGEQPPSTRILSRAPFCPASSRSAWPIPTTTPFNQRAAAHSSKCPSCLLASERDAVQSEVWAWSSESSRASHHCTPAGQVLSAAQMLLKIMRVLHAVCIVSFCGFSRSSPSAPWGPLAPSGLLLNEAAML